MQQIQRLVVVSNRLPASTLPDASRDRRNQPVGGLVSAVQSALEQYGGLWFGWSGTTTERRLAGEPLVARSGSIDVGAMNLTADEVNLFYSVFANRTLWPLLHAFPNFVQLRHDAYRGYRRVNRRFAEGLYPLLRDGDVVWVQDYHLIPLSSELRRMGWRGKVGFFLHTPFPAAEVFSILPWARQLLEDFVSYDLVGFHTNRYAHNFLDTLQVEIGGAVDTGVFDSRSGTVSAGVYPIGTDPDQFQKWTRESGESETGGLLQRLLPRRPTERKKVVLGVDRLDYSKGIPQRLRAFEAMLDRFPAVRGKVTMIQISAPSRSRVPEYVQEREQVDRLVGHINGRFAEADWVPVHYLYRSYNQEELAHFFREADVCLVTPLRDGMNLIAKEFVAAQGADPGVLVLSRFCGAAETMKEALIVNPYDLEGTAEAMHSALSMTHRERRRRWTALNEDVQTNTARAWADNFLADLTAGRNTYVPQSAI
ncbi:MAG: trehalose-6-phosphate synthase [Chloroflexi bacterium]|nr:trehalose-6-phosphate synthase [Chloroflexota bacterium]